MTKFASLRLIYTFTVLIALGTDISCRAAERIRITLENAIEIAANSSLQSQKNLLQYLQSYWDYMSYRSSRLPSVGLDLMPASYRYYLTQRYDSQNNTDVYRPQKLYEASVGLGIYQNVDFLGGTLYMQSNLDYLRNFGDSRTTQFSSVPVRIGYSQELIGFNKFKWDKEIEPLKFQRADKQYIYSREIMSEEIVARFFYMAMAQSSFELAVKNVQNADTLYAVGKRKFAIAAISRSEILTLELEALNAHNSLETARIELHQARMSLKSYIGVPQEFEIELVLPASVLEKEIDTELALQQALANHPDMLRHRQDIVEAKRNLAKTDAEAKFNMAVKASVGFNQVADNFAGAYHSPMRQDIVAVSVSVPLVGWGVRKGKVNMAKSSLNIEENEATQTTNNLAETVLRTIEEFSVQKTLIHTARQALDIATRAHAQTRERFMIGKESLNALLLSISRQQQANTNYMLTLKNYWSTYYKLRRLTLYDFEKNTPLVNDRKEKYKISLR